ncbi:MAG: DNA polymerase, partial [Patescibacteria group bacterium]
MQKALFIDGNALIHRTWHALPRLTAPDGRVVNAVYGFVMVLQKVLQSEHPDYLVVCWDTPEPTYRHRIAPEYKAQREKQPQEFYDQVPFVQNVINAFGGKNIEFPGYEADDLLATLAKTFAKKNVETTLLTSDRDMWQAIGPYVRVMAFKKGVSETVTYDEKTLPALTGLMPTQIVDWKALSGDPSDNLKGVPGIGDKTAVELLKMHGTLDKIFQVAKDPNSDLKPGVRQRLVDGENAGRKTRTLVALVSDVPITESLDELHRVPADTEKIRELFLNLGFKTLLARMGIEAAPQQEKVSTQSSPDTGGVEEVIHALQKAHFAYIHPIEISQESLFADTPALALGSQDGTAILSRDDVGAKYVSLLRDMLSDPTIAKIGHDLKRAWHWCRKNGFELNGIACDTEIAAYLLSAGDRSYDLATLAAGRLGMIVPEGDGRSASEVVAIRSLHHHLVEELKAQQLDTVMTRFELPLIPILGEMEEKGILIDREYFKKLRDEFAKEKSRLEHEMITLAGEEFNPASPQQLARILFDTLKISTKGMKRGKTGISTAATELEKLEGAHPIVEKIGEYREVAKLLSTYVEALPNLADANGRVHTTFHQTIAATGRLSSTDPNLQNIPIRTELGRKIRRGFVAQDGYLLLSCDYSQIELRVIAALAKDEKMLDAFRRNVDIRTATAAAIW